MTGDGEGRLRLATDIGGTFTDLVYLDADSGEVQLSKAPTTPPEFERGVVHVLAKAGIDERSSVWSFVHGTTLVVNALTERRGAPTALITTRGFRDVLEIGRSNRPDLFNLRFEKPRPFVQRARRFEVGERVGFKGDVITPLDEEEVLRAATEARAAGARAIAVCFLHSYANPAHEQRCAELVRDAFPEVLVVVSSEISKEWREYERTTTAVLNAYVQEAAGEYIGRLESGLGSLGIDSRLFVMQSNGGTMTFSRAKQAPINLLESGPVGGVMGAALIGELVGRPDMITLDIGGTTAKSSLIEGGNVRLTTEYKVGWRPEFPGYPVKIPVVDIVEIGAGGGSIANFDKVRGLSVGPESAGAVPGPACYPEGGSAPTVTDANLVVGRIDPEYFLGGEIRVSVDRAREALEQIAEPLGVDVEEAALGVIRLANASMVNAIRLVSVRRGHDPRDFDLVAFGGGGSMHAAELAKEILVPRVVVPPAPAHFSAWGMLMSDLRNDWIRTNVGRLAEIAQSDVEAIWDDLRMEALAYFTGEGFPREVVRFSYAADMRYLGQEHTVKVPLPRRMLQNGSRSELEEQFHALHEKQYTFRLETPVEFVNFHLTGVVPVERPEIPRLPEHSGNLASALKGERRVHFDDEGVHDAAIYERGLLGAGADVRGPAVVEDPAASTVVFPSQHLLVDDWANLIIEADQEGGQA